jgi:micrococcal nuclease
MGSLTRKKVAGAAGMVAVAASGLLGGLVITDLGSAAPAAKFSYRGTLWKVVDGDTVDVRLLSGKRERVRLIGIDSPEQGTCYAALSTSRARQLALNKRVTLRGDSTQATRDQYGRLLAYVDVAGNQDLGGRLIREGYAKVYVFSRAFSRLASYNTAQKGAKAAVRGVWKSCAGEAAPVPVVPILPVAPTIPTTTNPITTDPPTTTVAPPPAGNCHSSYPSVCIPPPPPDLDCKDVPHKNFVVVGSDPHRFDGNNDGRGCEG